MLKLKFKASFFDIPIDAWQEIIEECNDDEIVSLGEAAVKASFSMKPKIEWKVEYISLLIRAIDKDIKLRILAEQISLSAIMGDVDSISA